MSSSPAARCFGVTWPALADRLDHVGALTRWSLAEPALGQFQSVRDLAEATALGSDTDAADVALGALIRLAAVDGGDDEDAALVVAHLLTPGTRQMASTMRDLAEDPALLIAGELWMQIRNFPWRRRTRRYASNLLCDTRAAVLDDALGPRALRHLVDPVDPTPTEEVAAVSPLERVVIESHDSSESRLLDVLEWAQRSGIVTAADVALIVELMAIADRLASDPRSGGLNVGAEIAEMARRRRVNEKTIRRHRDRALSALRLASADYAAAVA